MQVSGFSFWYPMLMSLTIFGGSLEFVAVSMLLSAFAPVQTLVVALMLQARHLFYGIAMLDKFKGTGWKKVYLIFGMCDESFSINCSAEIPAESTRGGLCSLSLCSTRFTGSLRYSGRLAGRFDSVQHRGTGLCHDHHVCGDFLGPVAEGERACCIPDRAGGFLGLPAYFRRGQFPFARYGLYSSIFDAAAPARRGGEGRSMTLTQRIITIALCALGTMATRFLPFLLFSSRRPTPRYIQYLGRVLPGAIFGMLVIYCLRNVDLMAGSHGLRRQLPLLLLRRCTCGKGRCCCPCGGTICYMLLVRSFFSGMMYSRRRTQK